MEIGIDDLYDDDEQIVAGQEVPEPPKPEEHLEGDFMEDFLRTKGIDDINAINFEDENGNIETRAWKDLSREEQFNILNTQIEQPTLQPTLQPVVNNDYTNQLSDDEINFINQLREQGLTPELYINQFKTTSEPTYKVDDLSDDEIYLVDLESRVGELSDDEAAQALSVAKQNEEFFKKQVDGIRKEYKEKEDLLNQLEQAKIEQQQAQAFQEYSAVVVDSINNFNSIGNLDLNLEDSDKEELAEFMLSQDEKGVNYLYSALQDPLTLVKAAWFILNGDEALNSIQDYFVNLIKQVSDNQYKKGFEDGLKGVQTRPTVVIDNSNKNKYRQVTSIDDLDDD